MRLQKFLAAAGIASRRKCEELIEKELIKVNGLTVTKLGTKINSDTDIIIYAQKQIKIQKNIYIMLNKPTGYITTMHDEFNRPNVRELIEISERVFPIGRLDCNTSGLLFLTNDGNLTYKLTHPKHNINKTYIAKIKGLPKKNELDKFRNGLMIDKKITAPAEIEIISTDNFFSTLKIKIHEGRNRQIRKMCMAINHPVIELKRFAIENLQLDIEIGRYRILSTSEINYLKSI